MINKYSISKDDKMYRAFPDLILIDNKLVCVFIEMDKINKIFNICITYSVDRGKTWSERKIIRSKIDDNGKWDAPRINKMKNGDIIVMSSWYLDNDKDKKNSYIYMFYLDDDLNIKKEVKTTMTGIVPDKILELDDRWILISQERNEVLDTIIYFSYDCGNTWTNKKILAHDPRYNLCETSAILVDDKIVALMRENSNRGIDALKVISKDKGNTWSSIYNMPIPACHRPVITKLKEDYYLITYRFNQGIFFKRGHHGQNIMGCLIKNIDMLETDRDKIESRIFPIDYDRNINSNCGYTGVVQFDDGMIYVVSFIMDDNSVGQIRGYSFYLKDIILGSD